MMEGSWLDALKSASLEWRAPMAPLDWEAVKAQVGNLPPDLRLLYECANGVRLPAGLKLFPLRGRPGELSVLVSSRDANGMWQFGRMGERVHLFAVQKKRIHGRADGTPLPDWVAVAPGDTWVYGMRHDANMKTRLFPSLSSLLAGLLPDWLKPGEKEPEPEFAHSSDVQLLASGSLEVDIEVEEPVDAVIEAVEEIIEEQTAAVPPPAPLDAITTTEKVQRPTRKAKKKPAKRKPKKPARKARRQK